MMRRCVSGAPPACPRKCSFAAVAWYLYREAMSDARRDLDTAAKIAKEHALKLFDTNQMLLSRMLDLLGHDGDAASLARGRELHEQLVRMAQGLPQIQGLFISGTDARMIASNRLFPPAHALADLVHVRHPRLPVILMTGYAARLERAMRDHYEVLPKPCGFDTLHDGIGRALARRKAGAVANA
jgi:hypothetical protein